MKWIYREYFKGIEMEIVMGCYGGDIKNMQSFFEEIHEYLQQNFGHRAA